MSEQGWQDFLAAGLDDWVVLHGGATAAFDVAAGEAGALAAAADLAGAVARIPGIDASGAVLTVTGRRLTVRITRDLWLLEPEHVELAAAVSAVARAHGAVVDRSAVQEVQLAIAAHPESIDAGFWRAVLGYDAASDDNSVDPLGHGSTVWLQELDAGKPLRHAMHVDVSVAREEAQRRVEAAIAAGGVVVDGAEAPAMWILADRAGNKVCVCAWPDGAQWDAGEG